MLPGVHSPKTNDWKGWNLNMIIFSCQAATSEKCEWGMAEKTWGPPSYYELKLKLYSKWDFNQKGLKIIYTSYIIPSWSPINWDCEPGRPWQKNPPTSWSALFIALIFNEVFRWKGNDGKFENKVPLKMADSGALATWTPTSHSWHRWFIAHLKVNWLEMKQNDVGIHQSEMISSMLGWHILTFHQVGGFQNIQGPSVGYISTPFIGNRKMSTWVQVGWMATAVKKKSSSEHCEGICWLSSWEGKHNNCSTHLCLMFTWSSLKSINHHRHLPQRVFSNNEVCKVSKCTGL